MESMAKVVKGGGILPWSWDKQVQKGRKLHRFGVFIAVRERERERGCGGRPARLSRGADGLPVRLDHSVVAIPCPRSLTGGPRSVF
jgi:hypothetical protein